MLSAAFSKSGFEDLGYGIFVALMRVTTVVVSVALLEVLNSPQ